MVTATVYTRVACRLLSQERETDAEYFSLQLKLKKLNVELANVHVISPEKVTGRMEVAHQQYGMQLEENRRLVDQLNHLEGERDKVLELHKELERDLEELSKQLAGMALCLFSCCC